MDLSSLPGYVAGFDHLMGVRELGGQVAADGRTVRHGMLYRGAALCNLDERRQTLVDAWHLRAILDLRAGGEVTERHDYAPAGVAYERIPGMYLDDGTPVDFSPQGIAQIMEREPDPESFMRNLYVSMMFGNPAVHRLVEWVGANRLPVYFHCSAGKDRTGVCAAVLLMLLGVPDKDIVREYLLTNEYRAEEIRNRPAELPAWMDNVTPEEWARMAGVDESNLMAIFEAVDARYSTREEYLAKEFGLDGAAIRSIRNRLLM